MFDNFSFICSIMPFLGGRWLTRFLLQLGHPLGATGGRQLATLLPEMERQGQQLGVISMCIGTGMGMASLIVRE